MGKSMAYIKDGLIDNILWCSNDTEETDDLKDVGGLMLQIGDEYVDGTYYRNGEIVLSEIGMYQRDLSEAYEALNILGVFSV